jgi:hypothetical protein
LVAQFQYNKSDDTIHPQGEILKTTGRWHKKAVELSKAVISLKMNTRLQKLSSKPFCTSRTAGREMTEANMPMPWKKTTLSGKSAIVPHSAGD